MLQPPERRSKTAEQDTSGFTPAYAGQPILTPLNRHLIAELAGDGDDARPLDLAKILTVPRAIGGLLSSTIRLARSISFDLLSDRKSCVCAVSVLQSLHDTDAAPAAKLTHAQAARPIKSDVNAFAMVMSLAETARRRQPVDDRLAQASN